MRVNRALDKLRHFFLRRGITMPAAALAEAISGNAIQAAPEGLAASVAAGVVQGATLTVSTLSFVKGAVQIMTSAKISVAVAVGAAAIIGLQMQQISAQKQTVRQLEALVAQETQNSRAQQAEIAQLQKRNAIYSKTVSGMNRDVAKARALSSAAIAAKPAATGTKGNVLAEMFKNPDALEAMRPMQLTTIKMMYAPLVKQLNLS
jgi:cell division protein FtsL